MVKKQRKNISTKNESIKCSIAHSSDDDTNVVHNKRIKHHMVVLEAKHNDIAFATQKKLMSDSMHPFS